jgi:ankyrin repeat protein
LRKVRKLLDKGCDPNIRDDSGFTLLYAAAQAGHLSVVRELLDRGADPNIRDNEGRTPADIARKRGYMDIVNLIESETH